MSAIEELDLPHPSATDGEIAAINLESARRGAWALSPKTRAFPASLRRLSMESIWQRNFLAIWMRSTA